VIKILKDYKDLYYIPSIEDLICECYIELVEGISLEEGATNLVGKSSIDTWTDLLTLNQTLAKNIVKTFITGEEQLIVRIANQIKSNFNRKLEIFICF